jgi:Flp pilus assembly protein TadG
MGVARYRSHRTGTALVYMLVALPVIVGVCSLGADYARVQLVKCELAAAAESAARAGAAGIGDGTAFARASAVAAQNLADNEPVQLQPGGGAEDDVVVGRWDAASRTFTAGGTPPNAVQVTARRTSQRGTAPRLAFAPLLGATTCDVRATAVAVAAPGGYAIVGLNYISMAGNASDSYWSSTGYTRNETGHIASNGPITLGGSTYVYGDARPGVGCSVNDPSKVSGSSAPLTQPLTYPNASAGVYATGNDNANIPPANFINKGLLVSSGANVTLPGGNYYLASIAVTGTGVLNFSGPATLYCYGPVTMTGKTMTSSDVPANLKIVTVPTPTGGAPGAITVTNNAAMYATIYAPQSDVILGGSGDIYGSVVGKSVAMNGTSAIHYDLSLAGAGGISLVK